MTARAGVRARRSRAGSVLVFLIVFATVWAALASWTAMYSNAACLVAALTGWWVARHVRPFVCRRRR